MVGEGCSAIISSRYEPISPKTHRLVSFVPLFFRERRHCSDSSEGTDGRREGGREGDDCSGVFMDYYSESDESADHKVMASIHFTPTGLTAHECDYRGKTVYLALITAPGNALYCFLQSSRFI